MFGDWHPPLFALIWRWIGATPQAMLILQSALYWFGIACIADKLRREPGQKRWWVIILIGLTPISVHYLGVIQKDTLLTSLLVAGVGVSVRFSRLSGLPFMLVAAMIRANAAFAIPALYLGKEKPLRGMIAAAAGGAALVLAVSWVSGALISVRHQHPEQSVMRYDLAGIRHFQGLREPCYTPLYWDSLATPECGPAPPIDGLAEQWIGQIAAHPFAYLQHRTAHFNRTIFFLVPAMQQCVDAPAAHVCDMTTRGYLKDFVEKNPFLWPVVWLAIATIMLFSTSSPFVRALTLSGLTYGAAYFVVGVASDFRYFYWTELSVQLAMGWAWSTATLPWKRIGLVVGPIIVIGYSARYALL